MVSEKIVAETVKRMLTSNIDEDTIVSTLKDIGIDEAQARQYIANVRSPSSAPKKIEESKDADFQNEKLNSMQNELKTQSEKSELQESMTHNILNEHGQKLDEMHKKIDDVKSTVVNSSPQAVDSKITLKLTNLEGKISDVSAQTTALLGVMKKILENDRKILTELESKK